MYKNLIIYLFSGTGNSLTASRWISENANTKGIETEIIPIEGIKEIKTDNIKSNTLLGFCFATHGFCAPWIMIKFLFRFPKTVNTNIFLLNTRGGFKFFKFHIPGLSGTALFLPMLILKLKGYRTVGLLPLDMPHSWISFFPPNNSKATNSIIANCKKLVDKFSTKILNGKVFFRPQIWFTLLIDISLIPITILYLIFARFMLAKTLYSSYNCNSCRLCEKNCPVNAIKVIDNRMFWKYNCESCMRCLDICPQNAIQSNLTRISIIHYFLFYFLLLYVYINEYVVNWILAPIAFLILYWLLFWALRFKPFNMFITYTSMSKYWRRYIAPGVKIKDFKKP